MKLLEQGLLKAIQLVQLDADPFVQTGLRTPRLRGDRPGGGCLILEAIPEAPPAYAVPSSQPKSPILAFSKLTIWIPQPCCSTVPSTQTLIRPQADPLPTTQSDGLPKGGRGYRDKPGAKAGRYGSSGVSAGVRDLGAYHRRQADHPPLMAAGRSGMAELA